MNLVERKGIVLSSSDVPYQATLVFNAGVCKQAGKYIMIFRNDYTNPGGSELVGTNLGIAYSSDGIKWTMDETPFLTMNDFWGEAWIRQNGSLAMKNANKWQTRFTARKCFVTQKLYAQQARSSW